MVVSPPDPAVERVHLRHDVSTTLTVIAIRTELLQRHLRRDDGFSVAQRQRLEAGLADILAATRVVAGEVQHLATDCDC